MKKGDLLTIQGEIMNTKSKLIFIGLIVTFLLSGVCYRSDAQSKDYTPLENSIDSLLSIGDIVSLSSCIIKGDKIIWSKAMGMADMKKKIPVNINTIYMLGSLSKTMTGATLMHLYDQGAFKLDDDINNFIPFKIRNPRYPDLPISIRMVLTHTSSLLDNNQYISSLYGCGDQTDLVFAEYLKDCYDSKGMRYDTTNFSSFKPGENWEYCNSNYVLIAYLVERISYKPFIDYCRDNLLVPLYMNESSYLYSELDMTTVATNYISEEEALLYPDHPRIDHESVNGKNGTCHYAWPGYPDGGLHTNIPQFANFIIMLINKGSFQGKQILKPETVTQIFTPQNVKNSPDSKRWSKIDMGLTWWLRESKSERYFSHSGGGSGITTFAFFDPEKKIGAVFFITGDWHDKHYDAVFFDILRNYL